MQPAKNLRLAAIEPNFWLSQQQIKKKSGLRHYISHDWLSWLVVGRCLFRFYVQDDEGKQTMVPLYEAWFQWHSGLDAPLAA